jgi:hypothetical protein
MLQVKESYFKTKCRTAGMLLNVSAVNHVKNLNHNSNVCDKNYSSVTVNCTL